MGRRIKSSKRRSYSRSKSRMGKRISAKRTRRVRRKNTRRKNTRRRVKYGGIYLGTERPESCIDGDPSCVHIDSISKWNEATYGEWGGDGFYSKEAGPSALAAARDEANRAQGIERAVEVTSVDKAPSELTTGGTQKRIGATPALTTAQLAALKATRVGSAPPDDDDDDDEDVGLPPWLLMGRRGVRMNTQEVESEQQTRSTPLQNKLGEYVDVVYRADQQKMGLGFGAGKEHGGLFYDYPIVHRFAGIKFNDYFDEEQQRQLLKVRGKAGAGAVAIKPNGILMRANGKLINDDIEKLKTVFAERKENPAPLTLTFFIPASEEGMKRALDESDSPEEEK